MSQVKNDMGSLRSRIAEVNAGAKAPKRWGLLCPIRFDYWINTLNDATIEASIEKRYGNFGKVVSIAGIRLFSNWPHNTDYYTFRAQDFRDDWNKGRIDLFFPLNKKDL